VSIGESTTEGESELLQWSMLLAPTAAALTEVESRDSTDLFDVFEQAVSWQAERPTGNDERYWF